MAALNARLASSHGITLALGGEGVAEPVAEPCVHGVQLARPTAFNCPVDPDRLEWPDQIGRTS